MQSTRRPPRAPHKISDSLHHQLNRYALAASVAGVGVLALAQPAQAKVVYTPAHKWLPVNKYFYLDLNHDGVSDFRFFLDSSVRSSSNFLFDLSMWPGAKRNAVYSYRSSLDCGRITPCAAALPKKVKIGPASPFSPAKNPVIMFESFHEADSFLIFGQWFNQKGQAYLGLKFIINGKVHYGWARMGHISSQTPVAALLTGYAYETVPDKPIIAGKTGGRDVLTMPADMQPATLGKLALGRK